MSKYTIADVKHIIPEDLTPSQIAGVEDYLNNGVIPPYDPCRSCEPNFIRKLIALIQVAERNGLWPPKRETSVPKKTTAPKAKPKARAKKTEPVKVDESERIIGLGGRDDLDGLDEVFSKK